MSEFTGNENLEIVSVGKNFNNWIYDEIQSGLAGDLLEVGSGIGTFSEKIIKNFPTSSITLSDVSNNYVENLKKKFQNNHVSVEKLDLNNNKDFQRIGYGRFDSVFAINVLEHVKDDEYCIEQLYKMLRENGTLIILVPCHKFLYNIIDSKIGHFRRYTKKELKTKIGKTHFKIEKMFYFNMIGILGWYLNGDLKKKVEINKTLFNIFDKTIPVFRFFETITGKKIGLSIICFLRK